MGRFLAAAETRSIWSLSQRGASPSICRSGFCSSVLTRRYPIFTIHSQNLDASLKRRHKHAESFVAAKEDQERKEKQEEQAEQSALDLVTAVEMTAATEIQIEAFHDRLDKYDEATVRALMENQQALDLVHAQMEKLLDRAHVLDDGRRVFKTEDGSQVFDEFGTELDQDIIDPNSIDENAPRWEAYQPLMEEEARLGAEREALAIYQNKLDEARELSSQDGFTTDELESLEAELEADMPPSMAQFLPTDMQPAATPTMKTDYQAVAPRAVEIAPQAGMSQAASFTPIN